MCLYSSSGLVIVVRRRLFLVSISNHCTTSIAGGELALQHVVALATGILLHSENEAGTSAAFITIYRCSGLLLESTRPA